MMSLVPVMQIGPVQFVFSGNLAQQVTYDLWNYRGFFGADEGSTVSLCVELVQDLLTPSSVPDFQSGRHWRYWDRGDALFFVVGGFDGAPPRFVCEVDRSLTRCQLYANQTLVDAPLQYPLDQILTWGLLGKCDGILLHAAGVELNGVGYVLAGRSGAGKSTLSGLCHEAGWDILNDDRVILHPDPLTGQWMVSGTPWHGSGRFAQNRTVPLGGVYLLQQDQKNMAEEIGMQVARYALMDVAGIAWFEEEWSQRGLDAIVRLTEEVPVRRLRFTRSADAVEAVGKC